MKKKRIVHVTNWILLFSLPLMLLMTKVDTDTISADFSVKNLDTNFMIPVEYKTTNEEVKEEIEEENVEEEIVPSKSIEDLFEEKESIVEKKLETKKEEKTTEVIKQEPKQSVSSDVIATYTGNMSFYRASCYGCSGITSSGYDVRDGRLYYYDKTYGNVRIVAGGSEIPTYSIIRIKNSSLGANVIAIKLDKGSDIGLGRRFLIDMLTNEEEGKGGVNYNITVEVLRSGKA